MQNHGKVIEKKSKSHEIFAHYFRVLQKHTHAYKNSHAIKKKNLTKTSYFVVVIKKKLKKKAFYSKS